MLPLLVFLKKRHFCPCFLPLLVFQSNAFAGVLHLQTQPTKVLLVKNTDSGD
jgi:hypothetical protein